MKDSIRQIHTVLMMFHLHFIELITVYDIGLK